MHWQVATLLHRSPVLPDVVETREGSSGSTPTIAERMMAGYWAKGPVGGIGSVGGGSGDGSGIGPGGGRGCGIGSGVGGGGTGVMAANGCMIDADGICEPEGAVAVLGVSFFHGVPVANTGGR